MDGATSNFVGVQNSFETAEAGGTGVWGDLDMVEERDDRTVAESSLGPLVSRFVGHHSEKAWGAPRDLRVNPLSRCYLDRASCS